MFGKHASGKMKQKEILVCSWYSSITYSILGLFYETMAYKPTFHAYSLILNSSFYAYSAIVDNFVIVFFSS